MTQNRTYVRSRKHAAPGMLNTLAIAVAIAAPALASADETTLATVDVNAAAQPYKAERASSPKFTEPLVDTPQTIQVITEQLAKEQGATTLTEALRNSPGVGTFYLGENGNTTTGDAIFMRGFDTSNSIYVDGVRDIGSISRDIFNIEQIEVTKGPAGTDYGRSAPTGSINLATKRAKLNNSLSGNITGGEQFGRMSVDVNRVIGDETALRVNVMGQRDDVVARDEVQNQRWGAAASLGFGLKSATRAWVDVLHVDQRNTPDGGVPTIGLPGYTSPDAARPEIGNAPKVDTSNFYGTRGDFDDVIANMATLTVEHDISKDTVLRNTLRYGKTEQKYLLTAFMVTSANLLTPNINDPSTWTLKRGTGAGIGTTKDQENEITANQTNLSTTFKTGDFVHKVSSGVELSRERQKTRGIDATGAVWANLYNPDPDQTSWTLAYNGAATEGKTDTIAAYLFDTIDLSTKWSVNAGLRLEHYDTEYMSRTATTAAPPSVVTNFNTSGNLFNWKLGVVYKPVSYGSVYVNYATSMQPPGGNNFQLAATGNSANRTDFEPQEARTVELGTKWDLLDERLALTGAVYRTDITNEVESDGGSPAQYFQNGEKRVQGLELAAIGKITKRWNVSAGYAYTDTKVVEGAAVGNNLGSTDLNYTPKNTFSSWTTYDLGGGLSIGGGARYVDGLQRGKDGAIGTPQYTESYVVYDAMASYAVNKNLSLQLNVYNLLDEEYVASINKSGYRYTPGTPRTARLGLNFTF